MPKYVVLDIDGTLMDTNYPHTEAWARALAEVGCIAPRRDVHRQIGKGSSMLVREFVEDEGDVEKVEELHAEIYASLQEYADPLPGAVELIKSLSENGYEVWFVTSATPRELERHMVLLEAEDRVRGVVNSSDVENSKPAPDIFEEALRRIGATPEEVVSVGDTVWDVEAANAANVKTVAVLTGGAYSEAELREAGAVEVFRTCAELLAAGFPE